MIYREEREIWSEGIIEEENGRLKVKDPESFRKKTVNNLVDTIVLGESSYLKKLSCWIAYETGLHLGIIPFSIHDFYKARARCELGNFTVPAINLRTLTFDLARAVFRAARNINASAFIFEIAKSEIGYTQQRPLEYASMVILAGIKEGYSGPLFIQGDHFQIKAKSFFEDRDREIEGLKKLIKEAIDASFYNIDIDSSTLVDLSKEDYQEQQRLNYEVCALATCYIRENQHPGIEISIGGEIGEVGGKNSTVEDLDAFMKGYLKNIEGLEPISKISVQTGTFHGGVVLPDGSIARVNIDFDTLKKLSELARNKYGMAGAVQHGASTLPNEAFTRFPESGCAEIHLATQFQNIVYDYLPLALKEEIYAWLKENCKSERKPEWTEEQFIYKVRKKALGPFKKEIYSLPGDVKSKISSVLEKEFSFLFDKLNIKETRPLVEKYVRPIKVKKEKESFLNADKELGDLEGAD